MRGAEASSEGKWKRQLFNGVGWSAAILLRVFCVLLGAPNALSRRVEISTPVNSFIRLAEGYWLKQVGQSPYAGSAYHGSPLLLAIFGPLTKSRSEDQSAVNLSLSLLCIIADLAAAFFLKEIGGRLQSARSKQLSSLGLTKLLSNADLLSLGTGEIAAMFYLWNPFTIVSCVGHCTSSVDNAAILLSLYGAVTGNTPLATFGWAIATHFSLYPAILFIPIGLALTVGIDHPPRKLFKSTHHNDSAVKESASVPSKILEDTSSQSLLSTETFYTFDRIKFRDLLIWSAVWWTYILVLSKISVGKVDGLRKMFSETYGFILHVEELSPNLGLFWYFFTEVFDFFRPFFLLVFHANFLFMVVPISIRLHHRPMFLAFVFCAISAMLKSYPSVGDAALYLGLIPLFVTELSGMRFTFFLFNGYIGVALLSPVMYNLWIWRGTGNANFYFAMALSYACIQLILLVESVSTTLIFDRNLQKMQGKTKVL